MSRLQTVKIENENGVLIDVQHPFQTDGDSVYLKDIDVSNSDNGDFSGSITDYFDSLKTVNSDTTSNNPKNLMLWFNRTVYASAIGIGCDSLASNFGNSITVELLGSGEVVRQTINSTGDTNSRLIQFEPAAFNGVNLKFNTTNTVCVSNITIRKELATASRIVGQNPDGVPTNVRVTSDGDLSITDNSNGLSIAEGSVTGKSFIHKFGKSPDFDILDGFVNIWDGANDALLSGGAMGYTYSSTADIGIISSSSASDTGEVEIQGLDSNYDIVIQSVTLTGQTDVDISAVGGTDLIRVFRMKNIGSSDMVGTVYLRTNGSAQAVGVPTTPNTVRAIIDNGNNQTLMAIYTIPNGKTGYLRDWYASSAGAKKDTIHEIKLFARPFNQVFQLTHDANIVTDGTSYIQHTYVEPEVFNEKTDIHMLCNTGQDEAGVSGGFDIVLVDN
jgi:hypothetical protein